MARVTGRLHGGQGAPTLLRAPGCAQDGSADSFCASCCSCCMMADSRPHSALRSACEGGWRVQPFIRPPSADRKGGCIAVSTSGHLATHPTLELPLQAHLQLQLVVEDLLQRCRQVAVQRCIVQLALSAQRLETAAAGERLSHRASACQAAAGAGASKPSETRPRAAD